MKNTVERRLVGDKVVIFTRFSGHIPLVTHKAYAEYFEKDLYIYSWDSETEGYTFRANLREIPVNIEDELDYNTFIATKPVPTEVLDNIKGLSPFSSELYQQVKDYLFNFYAVDFDEKFIEFLEYDFKEHLVLGIKAVTVKKGDVFKISEYDGAEYVEFFREEDWYKF